MQTAAFGFMLYSVFSISENLIQFPFHGARLGKFQRIGLTDMVGGDAVTLCKAQNVARNTGGPPSNPKYYPVTDSV